jgi:hypothetical protein
MVNFKYKYF